jgi:hypothetical protein
MTQEMKPAMKQEPEEPRLKELFQLLKQDDERHAPSFAGSWAAAQKRLTPRDQPWRGWRFVVVAASVLLVAGGFFWGWRTFSQRSAAPPQQAREAMPAPSATSAPPVLVRQDAVASSPAKPPARRRVRPPTVDRNAESTEVATPFYSLVEDDVLAPLESGRVVRVEVPAATLISFGLSVTAEAMTQTIQADLLYGQDGLARAIRFLPTTKTQ